MRTTPTLALVAATLLLVSGSVSAGDWDLERWTKNTSAWAGHGIGSMVHRRTTSTISSPQMPTPMKTLTEEKKTLVKITETHYVLKVESKSVMGWQTSEEKVPKAAQVATAAKIEDAGTGSVTVEGKAYSCTKKKYTGLKLGVAGPGGEIPLSSGVAYVSADLGVLKLENTMTVMGRTMSTTWQVEKLNVTKTVGGISLACREMSNTVSTMGGKILTVECPKLPGGTVRHEMKSGAMGATSHTVTELIGYVKK